MQKVIVFDKVDIGSDFGYLENWLNKCVQTDNHIIKQLVYHLVSDDELLGINQKYLDHDYFTDIISFDYTVRNKIKGECWISVDRVRDNAANLKGSFEEELNRVFAHGVLHFIGYKDSSELEKSKMREMELMYLSLL